MTDTPKPKTSTNAKIISLLSNIAVFANLAVGFFAVHWIIIALFIVIHTLLRMSYLKATPNPSQTTIAPPMIKNIASVISAVLMAVVIYLIGYGVHLLMSSFA